MRPRNPATTSNPAQRLYTILQQHSEIAAASPSVSYAAIWAEVFDVEQSELPTYLSGAFGLISEIERCVDALDEDHPRRTFAHHKLEWTHAFVPQSSGWAQAVSGGRPGEAALIALGNLASILAISLPEGVVPSDEKKGALRSMVDDLIKAVLDDGDLDVELANLILRRLHDITWALDHMAINGPEGLAVAADRLMVAVAGMQAALPSETTSDESETAGLRDIIKKAAAVAAFASAVVSAPGGWYATYDMAHEVIPAVVTEVQQITK